MVVQHNLKFLKTLSIFVITVKTLSAEWVFFATSHGKSPCDGTGGTVKRVICQESLKQITTGQILDVNLMYSFCKAKINGICFKLFSKDQTD